MDTFFTYQPGRQTSDYLEAAADRYKEESLRRLAMRLNGVDPDAPAKKRKSKKPSRD